MSGLRRVVGLVATLLLGSGIVWIAAPASAHVSSTTGYATANSDGSDIELTLSLDYELLARAVGLGPQALRAGHDVARARRLESTSGDVATYVDRRVVVYLDGVACESDLRETGVEQRQGTPYARLTLDYACPGSAEGQYRLEYDVFSGSDAVVDDHTMLLDYRIDGHEGRAVVDGAHPTVTVGEDSFVGTSLRFVALGIEHILLGLDHVLFVLALLLGAKKVRDLVTVASLFTLAHSVTLAMAVLGWVNVPAWLVEPLIALSIAFIALQNLLGGGGRHRMVVVFAFGLLHGLGFAGSLHVNDEITWNLVLSLLTFNLGIELGQALLLATVFPLLLLIRRTSWSTVAYAAATSVVAGFGLLWFFERVSFV